MDDHVKHISDQHAERAGKALCGKRLKAFDWTFQGVDHWFQNARNGGRLLGCPDCVAVVKSAIVMEETG